MWNSEEQKLHDNETIWETISMRIINTLKLVRSVLTTDVTSDKRNKGITYCMGRPALLSLSETTRHVWQPMRWSCITHGSDCDGHASRMRWKCISHSLPVSVLPRITFTACISVATHHIHCLYQCCHAPHSLPVSVLPRTTFTACISVATHHIHCLYQCCHASHSLPVSVLPRITFAACIS